MVSLTILYFNIKLPSNQPHKSSEEDLLKNYEIIKYQKRLIKILKIKLFLIPLFSRKKGDNK